MSINLYIVGSKKESEELNSKGLNAKVIGVDDLKKNKFGFDKEGFDAQYLEFTGSLAINTRSQFWWANSVSEKNELLSTFYENLFIICSLWDYLSDCEQKDLIFICPDARLSGHIYRSLKNRANIRKFSDENFIKKVTVYLKYFVKMILLVVKESYRIVACHFSLAGEINEIKHSKDLVCVKSWIDHRSFVQGTYHDAYFTVLIDYLKKNGNYIICADIIRNYAKYLRQIKKDSTTHILPLEAGYGFKGLMQAIKTSIREKTKLSTEHIIEGINISSLLEDELNENYLSLKFLENILYYYKIKGFVELLSIDRFIYTFENYAWEKMCLLSIADVKKEVKCVGFQHAFVSKNSFKYFLGPVEIDLVPKPDLILTMGAVTKGILENYGHWPQERTRTAGALRQNGRETFSLEERTNKDILVSFSMGREDAVKIINFICEAGLGNYSSKVILRFHPQTPVEQVLKRISYSLPGNFEISDKKNILDDFKRAGIVFYTWTTVGVEALMAGLPVIYLNVHSPLNLDPLFECKHLKDEADVPEVLIQKVDRLLNLKDDQYGQEKRKAHEYLKDYFYPVTEETLVQFIN